ncbi:D-arabinono-1,4-lactone oxidase [Dictyobacter aurantiacus]|uniref:FAD-binding oxidoreductase n=1 Tax=Dictyobacter aurantiacus TaxID=1936993 RepID=A0A401ZMK3_9CHLR|nr:D-arabinono-1,4-lactone oxidase [Dictyobacter aurantiacus]GCE08054.1 FAD-binding oxidoreductase [Dictyobacter aurantiacus]
MATEQTLHWRNWSGSVRTSLQQVVQPSDIAELAHLLHYYQSTGRHVRVVGAGHSFTPLVETGDILVSLDNLQGIEEVDLAAGTAMVLGGTRLKELGDALLSHGVAQENLGDIDVQSIAGAISTGTHGTGVRFGNLSTQVEELTLVTASGEILVCSAEHNAEIFKAAQVSLGLLGVIVRVKLRVVPATRLHFKSHRERLDVCMDNIEYYKNNNDHFEFFWMPHTEWVQAKFLNETRDEASGSNLWGQFNKVVLENGLYWLLSETCRLRPAWTPAISKLSAQGIASVDEVDYSHRLFATPRAVRFQEMEYNIPAEHFPAVLQEIKQSIETHHTRVHFPVECRFVQADDIWLSPAYQRTSAYVAVHMYKGMPYREYFQQIEEIFKHYQGRPHWGKLHTQDAESLARLYPRWQDFQRIRASLDPQGLFLNAYLRSLFAINEPAAL